MRALKDAGKTPTEIIAVGEDAWLLDDAAWVEAAGSRDALLKAVGKGTDEEGRITTLEMEGNETVTVLPASVCELRGLTTLKLFCCTSLQSVDLSTSGLTSINESAFMQCSSLSSIQLPASLTSIGNYAFKSCSSLSSIELPASLTSIGDYAFGDCPKLSEEAKAAITALNPKGAFG